MREENEELLTRANDGDVECMRSLAKTHINNDNVTEEDLDRGKYWLEKIVDTLADIDIEEDSYTMSIYKDAQKGLALLYLFPFYEKRDEKKAITLWKEYYGEKPEPPYVKSEDDKFDDAVDEFVMKHMAGVEPGSIVDFYFDEYFGTPCKIIDMRASLYDYLLDEMRFPKSDFVLLYVYESSDLFKRFASKLGNRIFRENPFAVCHADITKESIRERLERYAERDYCKHVCGKHIIGVDLFRHLLEAILAISYFDINEDIKSASNVKALHYARSLLYIFRIIDPDDVIQNACVVKNAQDCQSAVKLIKNGKTLMKKALGGDQFAIGVLSSIYSKIFVFWSRVYVDGLVRKVVNIRDKLN